jgi:hypothetical protein
MGALLLRAAVLVIGWFLVATRLAQLAAALVLLHIEHDRTTVTHAWCLPRSGSRDGHRPGPARPGFPSAAT